MLRGEFKFNMLKGGQKEFFIKMVYMKKKMTKKYYV